MPAAPAHADQLQLGYDPSNYSNGVGGEFKAYNVVGIPFVQNNLVVLSPNTFETFCIEYTEEFTPGQVLYADINTGARFGGAGGAIPDLAHLGQFWDPLDFRTAYLYTQFSNHTLSNYNYNYGPGRSATAGQLQKAIWFLENEITGLSAGDVLANQWVQQANTAVAVGGSWYNKGIGNVRVLNLWTDPNLRDMNHRAQDQLVMLDGPAPGPLPAPLPAVFASGIGLLAGLGVVRRRRYLSSNVIVGR